MAIPLHTFEPTGDPVVDLENYIRTGMQPIVTIEEWFERNHKILSYTHDYIVRESVNAISEERAPVGSGVYFLVSGDRIVYVGKATSIYDRIEAHIGDKKFDKYWCFGNMPRAWLGHVEGYYIKVCKPTLNVADVRYDGCLDEIAKRYRSLWE